MSIENLASATIPYVMVVTLLWYGYLSKVRKDTVYTVVVAYTFLTMVTTFTIGDPPEVHYWGHVYSAVTISLVLDSFVAVLLMSFYWGKPTGFMVSLVLCSLTVVDFLFFRDLRSIQMNYCSTYIMNGYYSVVLLLNFLVLLLSSNKLAGWCMNGIFGLFDAVIDNCTVDLRGRAGIEGAQRKTRYHP